MNTQKPEPRRLDPAGLDVHSVFLTIQGEGPFSGHPAVFVRLAGCNLQCPKCDTEYTVGRKRMTPMQVVNLVKRISGQSELAVITGGEPFRQELEPLVYYLAGAGFHVQVETNGTLPASQRLLELMLDSFYASRFSVVVSPKTHVVHPTIQKLASAYKYVMDADHIGPHGLPWQALGLETVQGVLFSDREACSARKIPIYLQPMDSKGNAVNLENTQAVVASCMQHGYIVQLQLHKILGVE